MRDTLLPQMRQITRAIPHGLLTTAHHQMHGIAKLLFQQGKTLLQMCQPSRPREGPQTLLAVLQAALTIPHQAFPGLEQTLPPLLPLLPRPLKTTGGRTQAQAALATLEPVCQYSRRKGQSNWAAWEGVAARTSAVMSARVTSTSWPIPASTGIFEEKMAVATSSSLKHQRSSSEPPPRMITATCAQP